MRSRIARGFSVSIAVALTMTSCGRLDCTDVGGESAISIEVPAASSIIEFCIVDVGCADDVERLTATVFVPDDDQFDYAYTADVEIDGETATFAGEVEAQPMFPNGEDCGRSGKNARLTVVDTTTIETS